MKRILIFSHAMELGGVERSLLGLLHSLDYSRCQVDLFLMRHQGELMKYIPEQVYLLPEVPQYACLAVPMADIVRHGHFGMALGRTVGKLKAAAYVKRHRLGDNAVGIEYSHKYTKCFVPSAGRGEYDLAISFLTPHYFVTEKVQAKKKIAWIHTDYSQISVDTESELTMWSKYDYIASISDSVSKGFLTKFPELKEKLMVIQNILPRQLVLDDAKAFSVTDEMPEGGSIKLLSVGRFSYAKNFDNVPDICSKIRASGLNIKWYLIGYGGDETLIRQRIKEAEMEDYVIILGKKSNPYPYIAACDLYVQPSRYEGNCVTVREAQLLGKPVVITDYPTSKSQLEDRVDGWIVPMDNASCAVQICNLLNAPSEQRKLVSNCTERDYSNAAEAEKIVELMGD